MLFPWQRNDVVVHSEKLVGVIEKPAHRGRFMLSSAIPQLVSKIYPVCTQVRIAKVWSKTAQLIALFVKS